MKPHLGALRNRIDIHGPASYLTLKGTEPLPLAGYAMVKL